MNTAERDLVLKSFDHELSESERTTLSVLLERNDRARALNASELATRRLVAETRVDSFGPSFVEDVFSAVKSDQPSGRLSLVRLAPRVRIAAAAVVAVLVLVASAVVLNRKPLTDTLHYTAASGSTERLDLPDGSTVILNANASIRYPRQFIDDRSVTVEGEAFFDVAHTGSPFVVTTREAELEVLGTAFNVRAWSSLEKQTVVTLHEGSVMVHDRTGTAVQMAAGERIVVDSLVGIRDVTAEIRGLDETPSWVDGGLDFVGQPAAFVFAELERAYDLIIELDESIDADRPVTYISHQREEIEVVLTTVCHALSLRFRETAKGYTIVQFTD